MQEENKGPHTEVGNPGQRREVCGSDLSLGLARVAARARRHPKEAFNLFHAFFHRNLKPVFRDAINKLHLARMILSDLYRGLPLTASHPP